MMAGETRSNQATDPRVVLRQAVADAIAKAHGYVHGACIQEHYRDADAVLAVVAPELDRLRAERAQADGWATARYNEAGLYCDRVTRALARMDGASGHASVRDILTGADRERE